MTAASRFSVVFTPEARAEMRGLRSFDERCLAQAIDASLTTQPFIVTRNRKPLLGVAAVFPFQTPLWELRVGDLRVFYDGNDVDRIITIRAVRRKGPAQTTQEVLS